MLTTKQKKNFADLVRSEKEFLISGHEAPDGDVIGSTLAFALGLKKLGKKVVAYNQDGCPDSLKFLSKSDIVVNEVPKNFQGVLITVDSGNFERLGEKISRHSFKEIWNVDHHLSNTRFGKRNFIDLKAASTGQVVLNLLDSCRGFKLTSEIANAVYCTLSTDTGSFKYRNTTTEVFNLAARLVDHGADPDKIGRALYDTYPQRRLKLLQRVLSTLEFTEQGKLARMIMTLEDLRESGAFEDDSEDFVNLPRGVEGVRVVCFYRQVANDKWKLSLRSRGRGDVLSVAKALGGGGHLQAAGATLSGGKENVIQKVESLLNEKHCLG